MTTNDRPVEMLSGFDPRVTYKDGFGFEAGEVELVVGGNTQQVLGRMAACLLQAREADGEPYFLGVTVIAPSMLAWRFSDVEVLAMLVRGLNDYRAQPLEESDCERLEAFLSIVRCERLDIKLVREAVANAGRRNLILIAEAGKYRGTNAYGVVPLGLTTTIIPEDVWVPHVARLAELVQPIAKASESFVVLVASELPPAGAANVKLLMDVEGLYPVFAGLVHDGEPSKILKEDVPRWVAMAATGRVKDALAEIEAVNISAEYKSQISVQVAARSGDDDLTMMLVRRTLEKGEKLPSEILARLGRIALKCGHNATAAAAIAASLDEVTDQPLLEAILEDCTSMRESGLVERSWTRLQGLYPDSQALSLDCEVRLLQLCQNLPIQQGALTPSRIGFNEFQQFVADALSNRAVDSYEEFLDYVAGRWHEQRQLIALCAAFHALSTNNPTAALGLSMVACNSEIYERRAVHILILALRRAMLMELVERKALESYKLPLLHVVRYLST